MRLCCAVVANLLQKSLEGVWECEEFFLLRRKVGETGKDDQHPYGSPALRRTLTVGWDDGNAIVRVSRACHRA